MHCFAIHPPEALRAANRKIRIFMPENQKPKSHPACACSPPTNFIAARFLRNCDPVNTTMILLAFLMHTCFDWLDERYRAVRC